MSASCTCVSELEVLLLLWVCLMITFTYLCYLLRSFLSSLSGQGTGVLRGGQHREGRLLPAGDVPVLLEPDAARAFQPPLGLGPILQHQGHGVRLIAAVGWLRSAASQPALFVEQTGCGWRRMRDCCLAASYAVISETIRRNPCTPALLSSAYPPSSVPS